MDLGQRFAYGAESRTYRRIDPEYKTNIFVGYNDNGQMSFVIAEHGAVKIVKSSRLISVSMKPREDGRIAFSFDLLDDRYKSLFLIFCRDMVLTCEKAGPALAISSAAARWKYWKELFGSKKNNLLDSMSIKGLLGELLVLRDRFIAEYGPEAAVKSWMGPLLGHKDFEIDSTWYEVKSVSESAVQIIVSSLEQLESDCIGHLAVVRLEETSSVSRDAESLNAAVLSIAEKIDDPDVLRLFWNRLENMGYELEPEYDSYKYLHKGTQYYRVDESFPSLTRNNVPEAVGNAKYTILLNGIAQFREV